MKTVRIDEYGGNDVVKVVEVALPLVGADEVLIKVEAAGLNPIDWKIRNGAGQRLGLALPIFLGGEVAGRIEQIGPQVTDFKIGAKVYGMVKSGGFSEYVVAKADNIVQMPEGLDFEHAAAIPLCGLTAWQALFDLAHLEKGQCVLITGASGGVGSLAVQLAKFRGATVVGMASGKNKEFVMGLGADRFIDYEKEDFAELVHDMDVVFDTVGGKVFEQCFPTLRDGGTLVTSVAFPDPTKHRAQRVYCKPDQSELQQISDIYRAGRINARVSAVLELNQICEALALSESGRANGKIVIRCQAKLK